MKKEFLLILLLALFSAGVVYAQTNLLTDWGFEDDTHYGPNEDTFGRIYTFVKLGENTEAGNPGPADVVVKNKWYRKCIGNSAYVSGAVIDTDKYEGNKSAKLRIGANYPATFTNQWDANALAQFVDIDRTKKYEIKFYAKNLQNCDSLYVGMTAGGKRVEGGKWIYNITGEWAEYSIEIDPTVNVEYTDEEFAVTSIVISQTNLLTEDNKTLKNVELLIDNVQLVEKIEVEPELPDVELTGTELINDNGFDLNILRSSIKDPNEEESGTKKGYWYYKNLSTNVGVTIVDNDAERGKVARIERTGSVSWYNAFLAHWSAGTARRDYYRLTFKAKLESGTGKLRTHIKVGNTQQFMILKGGEDINYSAQKDVTLTEEWAEYYIDYDFNTVVNTLYAADKEFSDITDEQLSDLFVVFYPQADATTILIDDVSLKPHKFFEPAPEEGDLLLNTDFENVNSIPRKIIANDDKFSEVMGEWYFYAEPGLNGIDDAKAELKDDDTHGKVVALTNGSAVPSWWGHTFMQRFAAKPNTNIYRLGFYAKSNSTNAKVFVMINAIRPGDAKAEYVLREGFNPVATPKGSGARYEITTSSEWQYYECTFDFSQKCNNYNSPEGVGDAYAITSMDDDFLSYCYLAMFNQTGSSEILIDNISIEEIDTYTEIRNPGFETNDALPVKLTTDANLGSHSGQWVLVAKNQEIGNISVTSDEAGSGDRSMQLDVTTLTSRARYNFYLVMDIYEVEEKTYTLNFKSKASAADVPFRLDVYAYDGDNPQAITGENGEILVTEGIGDSGAGLKIFTTTTEWTDYSQRMTIPENTLTRIFIRPNITGLALHGPLDGSFPMTYWFDDFELVEYDITSVDPTAENNIAAFSQNGTLYISDIQNADVAVYNTTGQLIRQSFNVNGQVSYQLEKGVYIVQVSSQSQTPSQVKVLVK